MNRDRMLGLLDAIRSAYLQTLLQRNRFPMLAMFWSLNAVALLGVKVTNLMEPSRVDTLLHARASVCYHSGRWFSGPCGPSKPNAKVWVTKMDSNSFIPIKLRSCESAILYFEYALQKRFMNVIQPLPLRELCYVIIKMEFQTFLFF